MQETPKRGIGFQSEKNSPPSNENNRLLAIGIGDYHFLPRVPYAVKDTQDIVSIIEGEPGYWQLEIDRDGRRLRRTIR